MLLIYEHRAVVHHDFRRFSYKLILNDNTEYHPHSYSTHTIIVYYCQHSFGNLYFLIYIYNFINIILVSPQITFSRSLESQGVFNIPFNSPKLTLVLLFHTLMFYFTILFKVQIYPHLLWVAT